ncbi:Carnitine O-acetyltransferase [Orchesella cincta]|uniref:Carnitine O-acetyltransferase n=1 Tax=Orchesella cincta TaxID=48709 RepID=A0A1D2MX37_ORCCI|nr:Carnitine O-acetyltransferase [Orchesella cincta]
MCYGPVVPDGYGCCYNPLKDEIIFGVSAFNSNTDTDSNNFKSSLQEILLDMQVIGHANISKL